MINESIIKEVWSRSTKVDGYDENVYRKDACGAWMRRDRYGDMSSMLGWTIDHIYPRKKLLLLQVPDEAIDDLENLRAMQWMNNISKGQDYPLYHAVVTSRENENVEEGHDCVINAVKQEQIKALYNIYGVI